MFNNSGKLLKSVAIVVFFIFALLGVGVGIASILIRNDIIGIFIGVAFILASIILAWIGGLIIYAFGQLVQSTEENEKALKDIDNRLEAIEKLQNNKSE